MIIFHRLQSLLTKASLASLSLESLKANPANFSLSEANLSPLHQVLICKTHTVMQILGGVERRASRQRALPGQYWSYEAAAIGAAGGGPTGMENQVRKARIRAEKTLIG